MGWGQGEELLCVRLQTLHGAVLHTAMVERLHPAPWLLWPSWGTAPWPVAALALLLERTLAWGVCRAELAHGELHSRRTVLSSSLKGC